MVQDLIMIHVINVELHLYKIGILGNGKHSKRIQNILKKKSYNFYVYKGRRPRYKNSNSFLKLLECDAIFILTPNNTHLEYIKKFSNKNKYIFCEKPPVSSLKDFKQLMKIKNKKIYYNFNFRFSNLSKIFPIIKKNTLGSFLYGSIIVGHGLAFKKEYIKNWRSNKKKIPNGVYELVGIHWIDFINYYFGIKKLYKENISRKKINSSIDNSNIKITTINNGKINIFCTYTSPLINEKLFIFENGYVVQNYKKIEIRGPAKVFDKNNFFKKPPIIKKINFSEGNDYNFSLEKSVVYFMNQVKKRKLFNNFDIQKSLESNKYLFY